MPSEKLKKCPVPWCGCEGKRRKVYDSWDKVYRYQVLCQRCSASTDYFDHQFQADKQWNERGDR